MKSGRRFSMRLARPRLLGRNPDPAMQGTDFLDIDADVPVPAGSPLRSRENRMFAEIGTRTITHVGLDGRRRYCNVPTHGSHLGLYDPEIEQFFCFQPTFPWMKHFGL